MARERKIRGQKYILAGGEKFTDNLDFHLFTFCTGDGIKVGEGAKIKGRGMKVTGENKLTLFDLCSLFKI